MISSEIMVNEVPFEFTKDKDLLTTVIEQGYNVNHGCKEGRCKECKVKVTNCGSVSDELACQYFPKKGDVVAFDSFEKFDLPTPIICPVKINRLQLMSEKYLLVELRMPPTTKLDFYPGQYVNINVPNIGVRSYSIFSGDVVQKTISLLIGKVDDGQASEFFFKHAQKDVRLTLMGPNGSFFYRKGEASNLVFCATGSGIAPINAILNSKDVQDSFDNNSKIDVIWGNKFEDDFFDLDFTNHDAVNFEGFVTRQSTVNFKPGRITPRVQDLIQNFTSEEPLSIYACGHPDFIEHLRLLALESDKPNLKLYTDAFTLNR